ncbi:hypothetical protein YC2023_038417 [Brassica napus]
MHTKKIGTGSVILKPMAVIGPKVINVGLVTSLCVGALTQSQVEITSLFGSFLEATSLASSLIPYNGTAIHWALKKDLEAAIHEENYVEAAKIRDILKELQEDNKASISPFRNGDLAEMESLWSKSGKPCCVHPGAKGITGYDDVMESWEVVWMNYEFPLRIELKDVEADVRGEVGYLTSMEFVKTKGSSSWGAQFVSNVFERKDGQWFICIHHASPVDI